MRIWIMTCGVLAAATLSFVCAPASAQPLSFEGKSIKVIVPSPAGGGTDYAARLIGRFLGKYLPGNPSIVAQNMPGGGGITALNFLAQQAKPDGLTMIVTANTAVDPLTYRQKQAHYNPAKMGIVGGFDLGEQLLVIRTEAIPRRLDKSKPPVAMGSNAGQPRQAMRMNVWGSLYLGWNTKWVNGYPGSSDLWLALERGEIDMTAFGPEFLREKELDPAKLKILYSDGKSKRTRSGRADFDAAPKFIKAMEGKISDPKMLAAYDYWRTGVPFKMLALHQDTPKPILDAYREAFVKLEDDAEFMQAGEKVMAGFSFIPANDMLDLMKELDATSDEALKTTDELLRSAK